jgi:FMN phosphatase YigB (HAD superfamily)
MGPRDKPEDDTCGAVGRELTVVVFIRSSRPAAQRSQRTHMGDRIEALLIDLGRVILELDTGRVYARWAELAGVPAADIEQRCRAHLAGSEAFYRHERGEISDEEFFRHLRSVLDVDLTDEQFADGWNRIFVGEMPGIRRILARVQEELPLYAFSNTNCAHQACWSVDFADLLAPFRKIYVSNQLGARKPEVAAFRAVVADLGLAPEQVLFFDDIAANVEGARASGLRAVHVTAVADIERALGGLIVSRQGPPR